MDGRKFQFLKAVLGEDGAKALAKAAERAPELGNALLPRTIMAWLGVASRDDFEGTIPGVENTYLQFTKAEAKYSGSVSVGDEVYSFEAATILHLGACMAVALGSDHERPSAGLRDLDLQRLGKNIDTLVKARVAIDELRKRVLDPAAGYQIHHEMVPEIAGSGPLLRVRATSPSGETVGHGLFTHQGQNLVPGTIGVHEDHQRRGLASAMYAHAEKVTGKKLVPSTMQTDEGQALWAGNQTKPQFGKGEKKPQGGAEAPGPAHAATPPLQPMAPLPPAPSQTSKGPTVSLHPKPPKLPTPKASTDQVQTGVGAGAPKAPKSKAPTLKVTKAQALVECPVCDGRQFKADQFQGCICFRELAKSVKVTVLDDGYNLEFKADWDQDSILTLIESLGRK